MIKIETTKALKKEIRIPDSIIKLKLISLTRNSNINTKIETGAAIMKVKLIELSSFNFRDKRAARVEPDRVTPGSILKPLEVY